MSSFVRRTIPSPELASALSLEEDSLPKGCQSTPSGVSVTSLGVPSLDRLLLLGLPLGTAMSIREDWPRSSSNYSSLLLKCIIAEGLCLGQKIVLLDGVESDGEALLSALPAPIKHDVQSPEDANDGPVEAQKMTIAWRYRHLRQIDDDARPSFRASAHARAFDLGKRLSVADLLQRQGQNNGERPTSVSVFDANFAEKFLAACEEMIQTSKNERSIVRIVIRSLGSPFMSRTPRLLYQIKRLVHSNADAALLVYTLPAYSLEPSLVADLESFSDVAMDLQSFIGTAHAANRALSEYNGFFRLIRPLRIPGSLALVVPETTDMAFKIKRRQFVIETFHLPPDLSETPSRTADTSKQIKPASGCSSLQESKLEF